MSQNQLLEPLEQSSDEYQPLEEKPSLSLVSSSHQHRPASTFKRLIALFVDGFASTIFVTPFSYAFGMAYKMANPSVNLAADPMYSALSMLLALTATVIYYGYFMTRNGSTPGKMLFNLKVLNARNGQHLTWGQIIKREVLGKFLSAILLFTGYIIAFFRKDKRTLHDFIAGSEVVQVVD